MAGLAGQEGRLTEVPSQGAYLATRCAVRAQNDVLRPSAPLPASAELERRFARGREFEAESVTELQEVLGGAVHAAGETQEELEAQTVAAIADGVPVIIGGRLPTDHLGRRVGRPDLLVRASDGGYRPVDVKHHLALEAGTASRGPAALCSSWERPALEDATADPEFTARRNEDDLLQLAHYQRMLEAAGFASREGRWAGIVGTEKRIVWYDLDARIWKTSSDGGTQGPQTTMQRYGAEFEFRLDVVAAAHAHKLDPSAELLAVPVLIDECRECRWRDYCRGRLESGSGDVSLLPRVGWREWRIHHDHAVRDRAALARLDIRTAQLVAAGVDIVEMQSLIVDLPPETPVEDLKAVVRSKKHLALLRDASILTFGDLAALSPATAAYSGCGMSSLPEQIDLARAALGPAPIYRRRGRQALAVPRADIEVDIDMENIEEGVYLWGALVTDRAAGAASSTYTAFAVWEPITPSVEAENSLRFWSWLCSLRDEAERTGRSFRAYCYNASAENTYLRRLGIACGISYEVAAFINSDQWVDLLKVVGDHLISGGSLGLKKIAPLTGFTWPVEDPGGGVSMLYYDAAVRSPGEREREDGRTWLLNYNEGDVQATLAIRNWLDNDGASLPRIESLDSTYEDSGAAVRQHGAVR
jgi:predicted RecB family nuclease